MKVPYLDLCPQVNDEALWQRLKEGLTGCQFVLGDAVHEFESSFAALCETRYALGLSSGTDALFLALMALGIGPGDEVITVPNSFVATASVIVAVGARPVFVDVSPDYNMDVRLIEKAITVRTKAILPVHLTGNPSDMESITQIAGKHGLRVIEDAAQAIRASINGRPVGSFGDAGCFSLHPLKNLNVWGDGGMLTTGSSELYEKIGLLRNHGLKNRDEVEVFGYNCRLDTIQAIVGGFNMGKLEEVTRRRQRNASIYDEELAGLEDHVTLPVRSHGAEHVFHTYVVRAQKRAELVSYLDENGAETKIHYPIPIHLQKPYQGLGYRKGDFPECEKQAEEILSLPVQHHLKDEQVEYAADLIRRFYSKR